jgi:uncharacterized Zn finger protein
MKAAGAESPFDVEALRKLAGDKAFARGQEYCRDGQVELLAVEPGKVLTTVTGSEDYRAELTGQGKNIDGECSSRAFQDFGLNAGSRCGAPRSTSKTAAS